jgi:hypothetical protein
MPSFIADTAQSARLVNPEVGNFAGHLSGLLIGWRWTTDRPCAWMRQEDFSSCIRFIPCYLCRMKTVEQVIEAMGGAERVQKACVITEDALIKWRQKGRIPSKHWARAVEMSGGKVKFSDLAEML